MWNNDPSLYRVWINSTKCTSDNRNNDNHEVVTVTPGNKNKNKKKIQNDLEIFFNAIVVWFYNLPSR